MRVDGRGCESLRLRKPASAPGGRAGKGTGPVGVNLAMLRANPPACERGGIGRRTRLRIWLPKGNGSSTLPVRTTVVLAASALPMVYFSPATVTVFVTRFHRVMARNRLAHTGW